MKFLDALRAMAEGKKIRRMPDGDVVLELQKATVPLFINGLVSSVSTDAPAVVNDNWMMAKFPVVADIPVGAPGYAQLRVRGAPYAFSDAEVNADNWEVVP